MFVYLASPIDQSGFVSYLPNLRTAIQARLAEAGIGCFRPHLAYALNPSDRHHASVVDGINNMAIHEAGAVVAILPAGVATIGTPVEIELALRLELPVILFTDIQGSVQVAAWERRGAVVFDLNSEEGLPTVDDLRTWLTAGSDPTPAGNETPTLAVKYHPRAGRLHRAHDTDAGLDLATLDDWELHGSRELIPTGVQTAIPDGWYGRITGRSSALAKWNIQVHEGIIDAGYTGELKIGATFLGHGHVDIPAGTRLAQLILAPVWDGSIVEMAELPETKRGSNGWGSSGA